MSPVPILVDDPLATEGCIILKHKIEFLDLIVKIYISLKYSGGATFIRKIIRQLNLFYDLNMWSPKIIYFKIRNVGILDV